MAMAARWLTRANIGVFLLALVVIMLELIAEEDGILMNNARKKKIWGAPAWALRWVQSALVRPEANLLPATLVTSYYPLSQGSKHSLQEYRAWMENFLPHVQAPVIVYLPPDPEIHAVVRELRGDLPLLIHTVPLWELPPIVPLAEAFRTWQYDMDPERRWHSPELYAIWTAKSWMLLEAVKANVFNSRRFFWIDIGAFRERPYPTWPDKGRLDAIFDAAQSNASAPSYRDRLLLSTPASYDGIHHYIQGGFFGGSASAITWWTQTFYAYVDDMVARKEFVGKDQNLMTDLLYRYPDRFLVLRSDLNTNIGSGADAVYFFFEPFLAAPMDVSTSIQAKDDEAVQELVRKIHDAAFVVAGEVEVATPP